MRKTTLRSLTALFAATVGLAACGVPPEDVTNEGIEQAAVQQPGMTPVERLPLLDRLPDNDYPPGFNHERGWSEYRLADGKRALFLTRGAIDPQLAEGERGAQAFVDLNPVSDTWFEKLTNGSFRDYGRACELRVNNVDSNPVPARSLLKFAIPSTVTCSTISEARLTLTSAQNPQPGTGLVVYAQRSASSWAAGASGASTQCGANACVVASGTPAAFMAPVDGPALASAYVTAQCTRYHWIVTTAAKDWCNAPGSNTGLIMAGHGSNSGTASFHSVDSPFGTRPLLTVVY